MPGPTALLPAAELDQLRRALGEFTVDAVDEALGLVGRAAAGRGDIAGMARAIRRADDARLRTLSRLFLLGDAVPERDAAAVLAPLPLDAAARGGFVTVSAGEVRATVEVRPFAESPTAAGGGPWWVVSDFGSDVRPGPLAADHVLGIGPASLTLAQAVPRLDVDRALDLGTGSGVQALHLGRHAASVVATDVSTRALRFAATTAALSGQQWELRAGSLFHPVAGERFDLVVANPPFVVSAGDTAAGERHTYRDSGLAGDGVSEQLIRRVGAVLRPGGTAVLLANWLVPADGDWQGRVADWLAGTGCDAWVWQREVAEPGEYVALWLRDAGETPGTSRYTERYDAWLDWFEAHAVPAVGMGLAVLWRGERDEPVVVVEDVRQPVDQPVGPSLPGWIARQRWLADIGDDALVDAPLAVGPDVVRDVHHLLGPSGWSPAAERLRQATGIRWDLESDGEIAAVLAGVQAAGSLRPVADLLATSRGLAVGEVLHAVLPVLRDLIGRGFVVPRELDAAAGR